MRLVSPSRARGFFFGCIYLYWAAARGFWRELGLFSLWLWRLEPHVQIHVISSCSWDWDSPATRRAHSYRADRPLFWAIIIAADARADSECAASEAGPLGCGLFGRAVAMRCVRVE